MFTLITRLKSSVSLMNDKLFSIKTINAVHLRSVNSNIFCICTVSQFLNYLLSSEIKYFSLNLIKVLFMINFLNIFFMTLHIHFNYKNSVQTFVFMCRSYRSLFMKMVLVSVETIEIICFMKTFWFQSSCTLSFSTDLDIRSVNYRNRLKIGFEKEVFIHIYLLCTF